MLKFSCEKCGASYRVADEAAGKSTTCAKCGEKILVPSAGGSVPPGEPPATPAAADPMAALQAALSDGQPSRGPVEKATPRTDKQASAPAPVAAAPPSVQPAPAPVAAAPPAVTPAPAPQPVAPAPQPVTPAPAPEPDTVADTPKTDRVSPAPTPVPAVPSPQAGPAAASPEADGQHQSPGEPDWQEVVPVEAPGEPEWQEVVPVEASAAEPAPDDGIPLARPVKSKLWLFITLGAVAAVVLAAVAGVIVFYPVAYDLQQLKAAFKEAQGQADRSLPAGTESVEGLDEKALTGAIDVMKGAVAKLKDLKQQLAKVKEYQAGDSALRELAGATDLAASMADKRLKELDDELWPRPGEVGDMYDRVKASVPLIEGLHVSGRYQGKSIASGFLVKPKGLGYLLVTNRHVVQDGGGGFTVRFMTEGKLATDKSNDISLKPADVVHIHRHEDLAVLRFPAEAGRVIERLKVRPLKMAKELKVGRPIWVVGNPGAGLEGILLQSFVKGDVSAIMEDTAGDPELFRLTAPINKGNSGGPVLDSAGRVVGIVSRYIEGKNAMNFAVHFHQLDELIDLMAGRQSNANLVSLDAREIGIVVDPQRHLPKDLEPQAQKWAKTGFDRVKWLGRDANSYFVLPSLSDAIQLPGSSTPVLPSIVRKFKAKKGNAYSVLAVSGRISAVDIEVHVPGNDKPVFTRTGTGTSTAIGPKGSEFREDFVAEKSGTYEVRFVRSILPEELKGAVPQKIPVCACVVEQKAIEYREAEPPK